MKVLVTGGAGFIGSHIVEHFSGNAEVRVLDNLRSGFKKNLAGLKHEFIEASILDRDAVRRAMDGVDYVFHLAAMISVPGPVLVSTFPTPTAPIDSGPLITSVPPATTSTFVLSRMLIPLEIVWIPVD